MILSCPNIASPQKILVIVKDYTTEYRDKEASVKVQLAVISMKTA